MPAKNSKKEYIANSYYHIYNRGVEKRNIFKDEQDYNVFINYLKEYLTPKQETLENLKRNKKNKSADQICRIQRMNNFNGKITLIAYCLMPNHFHFLMKQNKASTIDEFMNSLATRYTMYFNRKYDRVGPLYQGVYKAVLVDSGEQLLYLSRYIHSQAIEPELQGEALQNPNINSYALFIGKNKLNWVHPADIMIHFNKEPNPKKAYQKYVEVTDEKKYDEDIYKELILE